MFGLTFGIFVLTQYAFFKGEVKGVSRRKKPTVENRRSGAKAAKIALKAWEAAGLIRR